MQPTKEEFTLWDKEPPASIFEDMKTCAIKVWNRYSDEHGYVTSKTEAVNALKPKEFMVMWNMFDHINQRLLMESVSVDTRLYLLRVVGGE
jgi:hypothetical protein